MTNTNSTHEQILAVIDNWTKAIRDANLPEILKNHTEDVLMFDVPVPMQSRGLEEYKKTWELFFEYSPGGEGSFELEELKITASERVAFCSALIRLANGKRPQCRLTIGLQKIKGQWMISHEHHSAPYEMN